jgi:hypothetical protein
MSRSDVMDSPESADPGATIENSNSHDKVLGGQEGGVLCSANVLRPAGSPLISLRTATPSSCLAKLLVCVPQYR